MSGTLAPDINTADRGELRRALRAIAYQKADVINGRVVANFANPADPVSRYRAFAIEGRKRRVGIDDAISILAKLAR